MVHYTREDFLREYVFPVEPAKDFERAGVPAQYASGHPKDWSQAYDVLNFSADLPQTPELKRKSYYTAVSSDKKLLAISSSKVERILIYNIQTRELCEVLEGTGSVVFRPSNMNGESLADVDQAVGVGPPRPGYTLVSSVSDEAQRGWLKTNQLILWDLDQNGRILDKEEQIDSSMLATKAIDTIAPILTGSHEWTRAFIDASTLHDEFAKSLSKIATEHRRRHNTIIDNARLGSFGSVSFSADGKLLLYQSNYGSTQGRMRAAEDLPLVVIYDMEAGADTHRLTGHMDAIMWSAFSPDMQCVATASWDGTLRMYAVSTGALKCATENSGGQSWAGAFSPDSKLIVWSSNDGHVVQVHDVSNGLKTAVMQDEFPWWCRCLDWHPTRSEIALCVDRDVYIWDPSDGPHGKVLQHFQLDNAREPTGMSGICAVQWTDEGRLLGIESKDGSNLVYNMESNMKELFSRPAGTMASTVSGRLYGIIQDKESHDAYLGVDGDGNVRFWRTSVAALPSWWEKDPKPTATAKKVFPETGKYVKVTKTSNKATSQHEPDREDWAGKGAALWTAE